jgi:isomerase DpgB
MVSGQDLPVAHAHALGLVDEVSDDVAAAQVAAVERLRVISGRELAIRRQLLLEATSTSYEEALGAHLAACDRQLRCTGSAPC